MLLTVFLAIVFCAAMAMMLIAAVAFIQDNKFFGTAPKEALSRLIKNKTVLIIAHRMRTIANADHIVVLKDGVVAEDGTPEELVRRNGIYKHMCETQRMSAGWKM